ncbi:beta-propeller fold lactonase family protein [Variovorax sp. 38R]|uniref:lactonase family protein n=1 Tax=Variovorax sp. 38R TaxID=2774875 RepID=UPI001CE174A4
MALASLCGESDDKHGIELHHRSDHRGPVSTVATNDYPRAVAVDPTGRFAYVANLVSRTVSTYAIDPVTGALSPLAVPTVATENAPHSVTVDPSGRFAYVANRGSNTLSAYAIDSHSGALSPLARPAVATGSSPVAIAPAR